jgi:hypothetical protein
MWKSASSTKSQSRFTRGSEVSIAVVVEVFLWLFNDLIILSTEEMKKRQIFAKLIKSDFNGWVEIDALSTMKFWDSPKSNYGIAIDIYDDNDNQLDAKEHFHLQNCEAGKSEVCCFN